MRAMGSEAEPPEEQSTTTVPILPLFLSSSSSVSPLPQSPERSGTLTPPLHSAVAAVPFRWEDEPGKPKPSTAIVAFSSDSSTKSLELPPRLIILENPPHLGSSNRFRSPSLRMGPDCYGSFGAERGRLQVGPTVRKKGWVGLGFGLRKKGGWLGSWRKMVKKREVNGSHVFPSCAENREKGHVDAINAGTHNNNNRVKMKPSSSFSSFTHPKSGVWTTICESLKHMVPWKIKKLKKDGYGPRL